MLGFAAFFFGVMLATKPLNIQPELTLVPLVVVGVDSGFFASVMLAFVWLSKYSLLYGFVYGLVGGLLETP